MEQRVEGQRNEGRDLEAPHQSRRAYYSLRRNKRIHARSINIIFGEHFQAWEATKLANMPEEDVSELQQLMLQNRKGTLTSEGRDRLIDLLEVFRVQQEIPEGVKTSATVVLGHLVGERRAEEEKLRREAKAA